MRSTLEVFIATTDELRAMVRSIEPVNAMLAAHEDQALKRALSIWKRLEYSAFVVSLYAALERFVEDLAWTFTQVQSVSQKYEELPEPLRKKHVRNSADLIAKGKLGKGRYSLVSDADFVANLHACFSGKAPYGLNRPAIIQHDTNLRAPVVQDIFEAVGVARINESARSERALVDWYTEVRGTSPIDGVLPEKVIELRIADLVDRRNQVAHGGGEQNDRLGEKEMLEFLSFVAAYGQSLFAATAAAYVESTYVKRTGIAVPLEIREGPIGVEKRIVVVSKPSCRIYVGQPVFSVSKNGQVDRLGVIEEVKVDDVPTRAVEVDATASEVGLQLAFKVKKKLKLFVLPKLDDRVWP